MGNVNGNINGIYKRKKPQIGLLEFSKTGHFGIVQLGQSKEWIAQHFPAPDSR